jgi:hypothetical protein
LPPVRSRGTAVPANRERYRSATDRIPSFPSGESGTTAGPAQVARSQNVDWCIRFLIISPPSRTGGRIATQLDLQEPGRHRAAQAARVSRPQHAERISPQLAGVVHARRGTAEAKERRRGAKTQLPATAQMAAPLQQTQEIIFDFRPVLCQNSFHDCGPQQTH